MKRIIPALLAVLMLFGCGEKEAPPPVEITLPSAEPAEPAITPPLSACPADETPKPIPVKADMEYCTVVCDDVVNLRESPSAKAELTAQVPAGTRVRVIGFEGRYANVELEENKESGYLIAGYLMPENSVYSASQVQPSAIYTYDIMMTDIGALAAKYQDIIEVETLGTSAAGKAIPVLLLGSKTAEKHVFIQASIHGREHMTSLLVMALSEAWLEKGTSEDVCFHVAPMVNPDGVSISQGLLDDPSLRAIYEKDVSSGFT